MKKVNLPKLPFRFCLTFFTTFFLFFLFIFVSKVSADNILFEDNFDDGIIDGWQVVSGNWQIQNQKFGTRIETQYTLAETQIGDYSWTNYEFEVDLTVVAGEDRNIFFRSNPERSIYGDHAWNWPRGYGLHITSGKTYLVKFLPSSSSYVASADFSFPTGTTHKIKMSALDRRIRIYVDNNLLIDFTDSSPDAFLSGRIALAASTGAVSPTEVWYDNVVVTDLSPISTPTPTQTPSPTPTPTPVQEIPIVFLPGLGGCLNFKEMFLGISNPGGWEITPGNNVYSNLLKTFESEDYFHIFCYDWRKPVLENAQKLNDFIKDTVQPQDNKVNLIGHSLGGLVSRACVQTTANNCYTDKLITVGSPHSGAVDAYPALEGGEIWRTGPIKLGYELFLHLNYLPGETRRKTLERIAPVLKDLLPDFDYLYKDNQNLSPGSLSFINTLLPQLQNLSFLENKTETITGRGYDSVEKIILTDVSFLDKLLGNWPDGKPDDKLYTQEGDTSVLTKSASFTSPNINNHFFNLDHGGIISQNEPLQKILDILDLDLSIADGLIPDEENYLIFVIYSPVKISLSNLPENSYSEEDLIIVPNPENKEYQLLLEGTGNGNYLLSVGQIYQNLVLWSDYAGTIKNNEKKTYNFSINKEVPKENPLICDDNNLLNDSIKSFINSLKKQINNLKLISKNKRALLNKLSGINCKKHEEFLLKLGVFRLIVAQFEKENQISKVEAEELRDTCIKLAKNLEYSIFSKPKNFPQKLASLPLKQAKNAQKNAEKKLSENSVFVFSQGVDYLQKAQDSFNSNLYYKTKIYSLEALSLFGEAKILSFP